MDLVLLDSINYLKPEHRGMVVVSGSHGGLYSAFKSISCQVNGIVLNDAGVGKDEAGIASLSFCEEYNLPVVTIGHNSARIGDAVDMFSRGRVSFCNASAFALGIRPGFECREAVRLMEYGKPTWKPVQTLREYRHELFPPGKKSGETIVCIDSASLILPEDEGRVVVTGSHGGLIGGDQAKAINVCARLAAFNDAGFGADEAGAGRLVPLANMGIAAVVLDYMSARIGDGRSSLEDGIISRVNIVAGAAGFKEGMKLTEALLNFL